MATVDTLVTNARTYSEQVLAQATQALSQMQLAVNNVGFTVVGFNGANLPESPDIPEALTAPTLSPVDLVLPTEPGPAPQFQGISPIEAGFAPVLTATAPSITIPNLPSQLAEFTQTAPDINTSYVFPEPPDELTSPLISALVLTDHPVPERPTIALPSFDGTAPVDDMTAPTDLAAQYVAAYRDMAPGMVAGMEERMDAALVRFNPRYHEQVEAIEAKLSSCLVGDSALSPDIEDAIYERAKGRDLAEARRVGRAAYANAAARGFTIPDGAAFGQDARARQAAADSLARASNEIAVAQAERANENLKWAMNLSVTWRTSLLSAALGYHSNLMTINGQALESARAIVGNVVEVYNLSVKAFEAKLGAYRAEAAVYDVRLKAAMSYIELYKAEIDALQAMVQVDQAKVAVYRGRIEALESLASVYRSRVEVVVQQAGLERLKLDLFRSQVEAFGAQAQVKKSELDVFVASMSGQESLVKVYAAQVDAYNSEVAGFKAGIDAKAEVVRATALTNEALANQYRAGVDAFSAMVAARANVARTQLETQRAQLNTFDSQVRAITATTQLQADVYKAQSLIVLENTRLEVETLLRSAEQNLQRSKAVADLGIASAQQYSTVAGAVMSGMNTLVSQNREE